MSSVHNRIAGCLLGYAIGDALGVGTEFMTRQEAALRYPTGLKEYSQIIRDAYRSQWQQGEFTHDTEVVLMTIDSLVEKREIDYRDFAARYHTWFKRVAPRELESHLRWVIGDEAYVDDPHATARNVYNKRSGSVAPNESLGRALVLGMWRRDGIEQRISDHILATHYDSRAVGASLVIAAMAHYLTWQTREAEFDLLSGLANRVDKRVLPYIELARNGNLDDFNLDDEDTYFSSLKTMGCALWVLWHIDDPEEALYTVTAQAGDADTNAALSLGLLGLKYGLDSIPKDKIDNLVRREEVEIGINRLTPLIDEMIADKLKTI